MRHHPSIRRRSSSTRRRTPRGAGALAALLAVLAPLGEGVAQTDGLADEADLQFELGRIAFKKGEYVTALERFLASNRLVPNRNVVFNIALSYEALGRFADAYRYYVDAKNGEQDARVLAEIDAAIERIAPRVAVLRIETSPPGATIYIDREDLGSRGRSPRPLAMPPGRYRVIAELPGYERAEVADVDATLGQETLVPLTLKRIVGTVRVAVRGASGAAVHVDEEDAPRACVAPCALDLSPGRHTLYFARDGFQAAPLPIDVVAGKTLQVTATLSPLTGSLVVHADERDALVEIDGRPMGFTPSVIQNVPVGERRVRVSLHGFRPVERQVTVRAGQESALLDLELEPIREVVAASRFAQRVEDAPASVTVISSEELRAFGYPTVAEALRGVRGIYLSNDRAYFSAGIRGLGEPNDFGSRLLVLSDGLMLNDNILNSSFIGLETRADLHDIDHIEVIRGPGSLLYGTGALAGFVNLVPRRREAPSRVHVGVSTFDNAVGRARAGFHYNAGPGAGVWASVAGARSDGIDAPVTPRDPEEPAQVVSRVEALWSVGTAGQAWYGPLSAQWLVHSRKQYIPIGVATGAIGDPRTYYLDTRMAAELRFEPRLGDVAELMARAHANRYVFDAAYAPDFARESEFGTWFGGELRAVWTPNARWRLTGGGEAQVHPEATLGQQSASDSAPVLTKRPYAFGAAYGIVDGALADWLRFSTGARVDVYSTGPIVVPRVALIVQTAPGGVLKIMGGRGFQAPSVYEQYYTDGDTQKPAVDPERGLSLRPESILSGEIEYSHRFARDWVALGAVHASRSTDLINTVPDVPGGARCEPVRYANSRSAALTAGADVELRREWRRGWMLAASYGYLRAQYLDDDYLEDQCLGSPSKDLRLINAPEHMASFRGVIPVVERLASVGLKITLEAPRRVSLEDSDVTRAAVVADLALSGEIRRFGARYVLGVYNLMDARYDHPVGDIFVSRTARQNGRTLLFDLLVSYP